MSTQVPEHRKTAPPNVIEASSPAGQGLSGGLKNRHLSMIAIGGVIGAGLFVGSGSGVNKVGPGILISYALTGLMIVFVMRMLGEMSAANPTSGSFSSYADRAFGRWAGFTVGWLYWFFWVVVLAVEATAGGAILHGWVGAVPQWAFTLAVMVLLTGTNLISVGSYGEFEFWFAGIKVVAIAAFLVIGGLAIFGVLPDTDPVGLTNLTGHGGFLPNGWGQILSGMLLVAFSFMGSEIVTLAAGESKDPRRAVTRATNSVIWRIALFYLGSILIVVTLMPWDSSAVGASSYVAVLDHLNIPAAGQIMNVIVLTAVLSCFNSGLYSASRMAFSLAKRGDAPRAFGAVSRSGVPRNAVLASVVFGFVAVIFNYTSPDTVFDFLLNSSGAIALFIWLSICLTQLRMRRILEREAPEKLTVKMWGFPYVTYGTAAFLLFVIGYMLYDDAGRKQMLLSLLAAAVVLITSLVRRRRAPGAEPSVAAGTPTGAVAPSSAS